MNITELINEIISEWSYRVNDGMPDAKNPTHLKELGVVLQEMGLSHIKDTLIENLLTEKGKTPEKIKEADKNFTNPILNKEIPYKAADGSTKKGIVGNLLRLPKDSEGRKAAEKLMPPEGSPERDSAMQDLGSEKDGKSTGGNKEKGKEDEKGKEGEGEKGGGEEEKAKAAQAMFDPKVDPAMASRLDKEKEANAKLVQKDKEASDREAELNKKDEPKNEFNPINVQDVAKEMPQADTDTFSGGSDIPDAIDPKELEQFNIDINKVAQQVADAKAKGEPAPNINLCDVTVPGTNLYCDDNLGIPRDEMPQFKGNASPGSKAAGMEADASGEVDTEPVFREMLKQKGIKTLQTEVPADKLKATQKDLVGAKVVGMMGALEKDPNHPKITAPIYVSRDGYVIDGHHRWAAIVAYNAQNPDKQIPMKTTVLDQDIKDAIPMANKFAEDMGIAAKKADANKETPSTPSSVGKNGLTDKIKSKIENWTKEEKAFFEKNEGAPGSEMRRSLGQTLKDKAAGAWKAIKKGAKHEVEEFKTAGEGIGKFFKGEKLSEHQTKALKAVAFKVVTTALFGAATGGIAHGAAAFGKHVAMEFIPHVIGETILKGAGRAALFADMEGESEMDANMTKFAEIIAKGLEEMEITPEMMEQMVDSYNNKKEENPQKEMTEENLQLAHELMLEMIYGFIDEAKPKQDDPDVTYTPIGKNGKPGKPTTIKYSSAVQYDKNHPAYIAAMKLKDKKGNSSDTPAVQGAGLFDDPEYQKRMGAETPSTQITSTDSDENPEGLYNPDDKLQNAVVQSKNPKELFSALDELGKDEQDIMLDKVKAGAGGPVASTGETLCTEAQTNIIQGRYNPKEIRSSNEYKAELVNVKNVMNGTDKRAKTSLTKELGNICDKMGYYNKDGNPDYELAMAMKAEADLYIKQNLPEFKKTNVAKTKFKKEEDMVSWMTASFYSSYSLVNNGPADWDKKKGNGRVMKANPRTQGATKQVLLDGLKNAKTPEEKAHYENQLKVYNKFKGYHDTFLVYKNDKGHISVYHISNKKSDELDDPQNNTTPETRLANYQAAAREANLSPKAAKLVDKAQTAAMAGSADNDNIAKSTYTEIPKEDVDLVASLSNRLPARGQTDVKDEYYNDLRDDSIIKKHYKNKYGDKWEAKWKSAKPNEIIGVAMEIAKNTDDISKLSGNFTKFVLKQGQLAQSIFAKAQSGMNVKQISENFNGIYSPKEIQAILGNDTMKMLADKKAQHAAGLEGVHKGFITSLHKADGTKLGHNKKNGPAIETYVAGTLKSLHIDTYVTNFDDSVQIEMGGVGCTPADVRGCMANLSGFKGDTTTPEGRAALNKHLAENVKVDADSDAVYLVGDNKQRTYIASDTWRQAGSSKKIATGFGSNLRKCLKGSVGSRLSNKRNK